MGYPAGQYPNAERGRRRARAAPRTPCRFGLARETNKELPIRGHFSPVLGGRWGTACRHRPHLGDDVLGQRVADSAATDELRASVRSNEKRHHERGDEPMKLTTMTQVTVDGVMQGNGGKHVT